MSIQIYALICALLTIGLLLSIYGLLAFRRKSGKSDVKQSRITLVISAFVVPVLVCVAFVIAAVVSQSMLGFSLPVGQRGGGVFVVLIASVGASVLSMIILVPRIKHVWED